MAAREIMRTADVTVRVMELKSKEGTEWHHHTAVDDFFVCLTGAIRVETREPAAAFELHPGERCEVKSPVVHRVVNLHLSRSEYLLVQGIGTYDFVKSAS